MPLVQTTSEPCLKRRRRESNPLKAALQAAAYRLAPASRDAGGSRTHLKAWLLPASGLTSVAVWLRMRSLRPVVLRLAGRSHAASDAFAGNRRAYISKRRSRLPWTCILGLQSIAARNRTWSSSFAGSRANPAHSQDMSIVQHPAEESNPVRQIRSLPCRPSHSQGMSSVSRRTPGQPMLSATPRAMSSASQPGFEPGPRP